MTEYFRFKWSHQLLAHRLLVRVYNAVMQIVPFRIKYGIGLKFRRNRPPYSLISTCSVVVQVGAPADTLLAGRSRGMYFSLLAPANCRVVVIEPDPASVERYSLLLRARGIRTTVVCQMGAWSEKKMLKLYVNRAHPASNFTEGTVNYEARRLRDYQMIEIPVDTVDNIVDEQGIKKIDLISINTNGAELAILGGMTRLLKSGVRYIALARTGNDYVEMMERYGYQLLAHDDRGYTFEAVG